MSAQIHEPDVPITPADIAAFERKVGVTLPPRYRDFLLEHNGGQVRPWTFDMQASCFNRSWVKYFLSIGERYSIEKWCNALKDPTHTRMPPEYLPIAACEGGDFLCIALTGKELGRIFFWDHEEEGDLTYPYDNLYFVADDIDALLGTLYDSSAQ